MMVLSGIVFGGAMLRSFRVPVWLGNRSERFLMVARTPALALLEMIIRNLSAWCFVTCVSR